jgi:hypothetical protein
VALFFGAGFVAAQELVCACCLSFGVALCIVGVLFFVLLFVVLAYGLMLFFPLFVIV